MWYILYDLCSHTANLQQDDSGWYYINYEHERIRVSSYLLRLYDEIKNNYSMDVSETRSGLNYEQPNLLAYIVDTLGENILMGKIPRFPGDINGDGDVNIQDIQYFFDYLLKVVAGTYGILFKSNVRHFRKCYSVNDLIPLVEKGTDLSSKLFIVTVTAACYGDTTAIAEADCGSDIKEITGVAYNGKPLYDAAVSAASSYGDTCDTKDAAAFEDFVLRYYGFLFALKCGDLCKAQYYWENYLNVGKTRCKRAYTKPCGCHGLY